MLAARKAYHRVDDEVSRSLDVSMFQDDRIFEEVRFVDFYRYCDAGLDEMLSYLDRTVPWLRPSDTGRSTNCLINDVGIYIHQQERGYHNYALPYSWDVRLGAQDARRGARGATGPSSTSSGVRKILTEIGYEERRAAARATLAAYYVASRELSGGAAGPSWPGELPAALSRTISSGSTRCR